MSDTTEQVVEQPAPDANATANPNANPESSSGANDTGDSAKPKNGSQRRIDELTWHRRNLERDVEYWRTLAMQGQRPPQAEQPQEKPTKQNAPKKLADFEYDEEKYAEYLTDYAAERAAERLEEKRSKKETEESRKQRFEKFKDLESKFRTEVEDYEDVAHYARIDNHVAELVMDMDEGPRIAYHLGKNPDLAKKLNSMSASSAAIELGRIDAQLANERTQAKTKPVSKAPPPASTINATEPAVEKDPSTMSDAEFAKWRKKQIAARKR